MKIIKKGDVIVVIGRRWFDRVNGNTYHSAEVYLNGHIVGREGFTYGYDDHYLQTARELLEEKYKLPIDKNQALWRLKDVGIGLIGSVTDVSRKKDL